MITARGDATARLHWQRVGPARIEADLKLEGFGWWLRVYAGSSYCPRPIVHPWRWDYMRGMTVRFSRNGWKRPNGCPVIGMQWRRA